MVSWVFFFDILIIDRLNKIMLLFENKIQSDGTKSQVVKYKQTVKLEFRYFIPNVPPEYLSILSVILSLSGLRIVIKRN
ncbi:MAG: PD-(D/E)XK nuclease family protein [Planctomycetota bacterium]